jgi:hypothetical protein
MTDQYPTEQQEMSKFQVNVNGERQQRTATANGNYHDGITIC